MRDAVRVGIGVNYAGVQRAAGGATPVPGVFALMDIDLSSDVDDVGDMAIANYLMSQSLFNIIGIGIDVTNTYSPGAADAINTYYGHADIPIGANKGSAFDPGGPGSYAQHLSENFTNDVLTASGAEEIVAMYQRLLTAADDNSIVIIATGPLKIVSQLLAASSALITAKVRELVCVAGVWPSAAVEWNVDQDKTAANDVAANWPTQITWVGIELGNTVKAGNGISSNTPSSSPVRKAYELTSHDTDGREAWSLFAMLYVAYGLSDSDYTYFTRTQGTGSIDASTGATTFSAGAGTHYYLRKALTDIEYHLMFNEWLFWDPGEAVPTQPALVVNDAFTDSNGTSLASHTIAPTNTPPTAWTEQVGAWTISSNAATVAASAGGDNILWLDAGVADVVFEALITLAPSTCANVGIMFNYQDASNYWLAGLFRDGSLDTLEIYKRVSGTYTQVYQDSSAGLTLGSTVTLRMVTNGDAIEVLVNNGDSAYAIYSTGSRDLKTATKHGLRIYKKTPADGGTDNGSVFNSFSVRPLT